MINIVGPRQTGKTTLVRDMLQTARFLNLDDEGLLASLALDPFGQLSAVADEARVAGLPVVIDEVHRALNCSNLRHLPSVAGLKSEDGLKDTRKAFLWGSYGEPDGVPLLRNVPNRRCHAYRKASITIRSNMRSERRRRRKSSGRAAKPPV